MKKNNVTRKELAISITEKLGVSQRNAAEIVDTVFATLKNTLINGKSIKSVTTGKAGGLKDCEPLKAVYSTDSLTTIRWSTI
jgi:O-phosphoseryl-tRNA(Cys) synthetase